MKILVTGASGFIGSFIVEEALKRGMETWAGVRKSSSRQYLTDKRIHFINLDFSSEKAMEECLRGHDFDYIVHTAGATKCLHTEDFFRINTEGTKNFVHAILNLGINPKRFVYLSSLSVFGAIKEKMPHAEIKEDDVPRPNTAYGKSKLEAEKFLDSIGNDFHYVILRPTGVYGPREKDYFMMAKSIKGHFDTAVGYRHQDITFVYVEDVVQAVFLSLDRAMDGRKYFLSDGNVYTSKDFSDLIHRELGSPWWIRLRVPLFILKAATFIGQRIANMTGKMTPLNDDKYNILKQRNWKCDIEPAIDELGYHPHVKLEEGVRRAMAWYKANKWL
jgi:nucleoside-diphosphate-sugar epimerase